MWNQLHYFVYLGWRGWPFWWWGTLSNFNDSENWGKCIPLIWWLNWGMIATFLSTLPLANHIKKFCRYAYATIKEPVMFDKVSNFWIQSWPISYCKYVAYVILTIVWSFFVADGMIIDTLIPNYRKAVGAPAEFHPFHSVANWCPCYCN